MTAAIAITAPAIPPPIAAPLFVLCPLIGSFSLLDFGIEEEVVMVVVVAVVKALSVGVAVVVRALEVVVGLMMVNEGETNRIVESTMVPTK